MGTYRIFRPGIPDRLKSMIVASARDVDAAVHEIREWGKSRWAVAVMPLVTNDVPVDHTKLDPIWRAADEHDLPIVHHSFAWTPPSTGMLRPVRDDLFFSAGCRRTRGVQCASSLR